MSATNRGAERIENDAYETPRWVVDRLLEGLELPAGHWVDPCAGSGEIVRAVNARRNDVRWSTVELRDCCEDSLRTIGGLCRVEIGDFFTLPNWRNAVSPNGDIDVVIMNPPYSEAERFIRFCYELSPVVVALLRLNFLASGERREWLNSFMPDVFVLPNRPSFRGRPGFRASASDSTEYAWMIWERGARRSRGLVQVLGLSSKRERGVR